MGNLIITSKIKDNKLFYYESSSDDEEHKASNHPLNPDLSTIASDVAAKIMDLLLEKELLELVENPNTSKVVVRQSGAFFIKRPLYVRLIYEVKTLPVKLNLPMVVPPRPWSLLKAETKRGKSCTVLTGGYLTNPVDMLYRFSLLTSKNLDLFKLRLNF